MLLSFLQKTQEIREEGKAKIFEYIETLMK